MTGCITSLPFIYLDENNHIQMTVVGDTQNAIKIACKSCDFKKLAFGNLCFLSCSVIW